MKRQSARPNITVITSSTARQGSSQPHTKLICLSQTRVPVTGPQTVAHQHRRPVILHNGPAVRYSGCQPCCVSTNHSRCTYCHAQAPITHAQRVLLKPTMHMFQTSQRHSAIYGLVCAQTAALHSTLICLSSTDTITLDTTTDAFL